MTSIVIDFITSFSFVLHRIEGNRQKWAQNRAKSLFS